MVRHVPDSFAAALRRDPQGPAPDPARARAEHERYVGALTSAGYRVAHVAADEAHPDCPFVEDVAVIIGGTAVATRPGAAARRGEVKAVADVLARFFPVERVRAPATVDGGDVLQVGRRLFVGRSDRTNDAGVAAMRAAGAAAGMETTVVPVTGALHLKSVVDRLDDETVIAARGRVDRDHFAGVRVIEGAAGDPRAANVLVLAATGRVLCGGTAETRAKITAAGFAAEPFDASEFARADGSLTCLSIRW